MDFLTRLALAGAAVLFAAWAAIVGGRWIARQFAAIRPYLAAFLVFTFVAMNYAQKSGTNEPPRGVSNGRVEHVERVEGPNESTCSTRSTWLNDAALSDQVLPPSRILPLILPLVAIVSATVPLGRAVSMKPPPTAPSKLPTAQFGRGSTVSAIS